MSGYPIIQNFVSVRDQKFGTRNFLVLKAICRDVFYSSMKSSSMYLQKQLVQVLQVKFHNQLAFNNTNDS